MVTSAPSTHLEQLRLKNFRLFGELDIAFHPELTVFVAPNGGGKTAVLDAIAMALRALVDRMDDPGKLSPKFGHAGDVRRIQGLEGKMEPIYPVQIEARATLLGQSLQWQRTNAGKQKSDSARSDVEAIEAVATRLTKHIMDYAERKVREAPTLPLIAYYGTGRLWNVTRTPKAKRGKDETPNARSRGYADGLAPSSRFSAFVDWFRRYAYEAKQEDINRSISPHRPRVTLATIQVAVADVLGPTTGWGGLEWDFAEDTLRISHPTIGQLPVHALSDGLRTMIGLVGDLARRANLLNPHLATAALEAPGIVLIDEVDMHLHPEWQQDVLSTLRHAFPNVQFIVTTHSPQVLSTVQAECIRILRPLGNGVWSALPPQEETLGVESSRVMATVMDVNPVPASVEETEWVTEFHQLAAAGEFESPRAHELRQKLVARYGETHPIVQDCDRIVRIERFKQRLGKPASDAEAKAG